MRRVRAWFLRLDGLFGRERRERDLAEELEGDLQLHMSYTVTRRTNKIGIRLALGATRGGVLGMVLRESLSLVVAGVAIGIPATLATARFVSARLFGVSPADPATIAAAGLLMLAVAALAAFLPARRAAKVDPMAALRYE